jgi:O-antigen/teichoic acid export membrane protein
VLGVGLYGVYSYGHTLVTIASGFALLGTDKSILKFIPQCEDDRSEQNRVLGLVSLTALAGGVVIGAVIYTLAPIITEVTLENPLLTDVLRVFAFFVLLQTLSTSWVVCSRVLNFRRIGWGF